MKLTVLLAAVSSLPAVLAAPPTSQVPSFAGVPVQVTRILDAAEMALSTVAPIIGNFVALALVFGVGLLLCNSSLRFSDRVRSSHAPRTVAAKRIVAAAICGPWFLPTVVLAQRDDSDGFLRTSNTIYCLPANTGCPPTSIYTDTSKPDTNLSSSLTNTASPTTTGGKKTPVGAIAGGVIGGVVFLLLVGGLLFFLTRRRRKATPSHSHLESSGAFNKSRTSSPTSPVMYGGGGDVYSPGPAAAVAYEETRGAPAPLAPQPPPPPPPIPPAELQSREVDGDGVSVSSFDMERPHDDNVSLNSFDIQRPNEALSNSVPRLPMYQPGDRAL